MDEKNKELEKTIEKLKQTQAQLVQQEKLAGIGHLAAGIAHEINNPLGFIVSNFDTLNMYINKYKKMIELYSDYINKLACKDDEDFKNIKKFERRNDIDFINEDIEILFSDTFEGLERVRDIVKNLKLFSRIDFADEFEAYDVNEAINNTIVIAKNEIKYTVEVVKKLGNIPPIYAVGGQINQVLLNIIINASYAIKEKNLEGLGIIYIETYSDETYVYCKIKDNGIGIDEDNIHLIFNPFFTTKPVGKGTGLGLNIAYDIIVNKHRGDIKVESKKGIGTSFLIKIPINREERE